MTYKVGDFAGYSPVTGQPTYVILGEEATMRPDDTLPIYNEEERQSESGGKAPDVIAQVGPAWRVIADGTLQAKQEGKWERYQYMLSPQVASALMADLYRRVRKDMKRGRDNAYGLLGRLTERIEAVEDDQIKEQDAVIERVEESEAKISRTYAGIADLNDRVSALEQDPFVEHGKRQALEERVAAVEAKQGDAERLWNSLDVIWGRLSTLEARQQDEAPSGNKCWTQCGREDEAGEGAGEPPKDLAGAVTMALRVAEKDSRRELAREIAREIRTRDWPAAAPGLAIANWIAREFGGE